MAVKIFFCYAREDEELLNKLKAHLKPLQRKGLIDVWYDRDISAGTEWEHEISKHLEEAEIILLLISPDFMNSEYCYNKEMVRAMERHEYGEARVIPVILRPVYWHDSPFGKLQALPKDAKPITEPSWRNRDTAFLSVVDGIQAAIKEFQLEKARDQELLSSHLSAIFSTHKGEGRIKLAQSNTPFVVLMAGLPGSGKTTIAYALKRALGWQVIDKDAIQEALLELGWTDELASLTAYERALEELRNLVQNQHKSVILDSPALNPSIFEKVNEIVRNEENARLVVILCVADRDTRNHRLRRRLYRITAIRVDSETIADYLHLFNHLPSNKLILYTANDFEKCLELTLEYLVNIEKA